MKPPIILLALLSIPAWAQEAMTVERFKSIVATPGDAEPLRAELAILPLWPHSKTSMSLTYADGRRFDEECVVAAKTVQGKYIVISLDSKLYKQTMHSITGYVEKGKTVKDWGLFGETLTEAAVIVDPEKKVRASTASLGNGLTELPLSCFSDQEASSRGAVYKDGVLFMTRLGKTQPIPAPAPAEAKPAGGKTVE